MEFKASEWEVVVEGGEHSFTFRKVGTEIGENPSIQHSEFDEIEYTKDELIALYFGLGKLLDELK